LIAVASAIPDGECSKCFGRVRILSRLVLVTFSSQLILEMGSKLTFNIGEKKTATGLFREI